MRNNILENADLGTAISDWDTAKWQKYAGCILVIEVGIGDDGPEKVIGVVRSEEEFDRDNYPDSEVVELFPVPHKGGIGVIPE